MKVLELSLHCLSPGVLGSTSFALAVWCPVKGSLGDVALLSTDYMANPVPSPSHKDGSQVVLIAQAKKVLVGDGFGPEYSLYFP